MGKSLLQRSDPETITQFESAARLRYFDAIALSTGRGRNLGAVYLFGYSIEMRIKAAFFRVEGVRAENDPITDAIRAAAWATAKSRYLPPGLKANQHDLVLWSRLLADELQRNRPSVTAVFRTDIVSGASAAYAIWGESLRYRSVQPTGKEHRTMSGVARWFHMNYGRMI